MALLKTDFAEGNVLWALNATSTSGLNGITAVVNSKMKFIGYSTDKTATTNTSVETQIGTVLIAASSVITGIKIDAGVQLSVNGAADECTFKVYSGPYNDLDLIDTAYLYILGTDITNFKMSTVLAGFDNTQAWANSSIVLVTATHGTADNQTTATCRYILVEGY